MARRRDGLRSVGEPPGVPPLTMYRPESALSRLDVHCRQAYAKSSQAYDVRIAPRSTATVPHRLGEGMSRLPVAKIRPSMPRTAFSHSCSVGNLAPAQAAYANAS